MPILFNSLLEADFALTDVRLLRHKDSRSVKGRTPYNLWRDDPHQFEKYQAVQSFNNRKKLDAHYWASFIVNEADETIFVGIYAVKYTGLLPEDMPMPQAPDEIDQAGSCDLYETTLQENLGEYIGKLLIEWNDGKLAWIQKPLNQNKRIVELRSKFQESSFPGFLDFIEPLSKIGKLPKTWQAALQSSRGVYLLTDPKTKEHYVGSATGPDGFLGRWREYVENGHGGNVGLQMRDPTDYQVSILEVAGSSATKNDLLKIEGRWQRKLQSKEMGLNRNLAG